MVLREQDEGKFYWNGEQGKWIVRDRRSVICTVGMREARWRKEWSTSLKTEPVRGSQKWKKMRLNGMIRELNGWPTPNWRSYMKADFGLFIEEVSSFCNEDTFFSYHNTCCNSSFSQRAAVPTNVGNLPHKLGHLLKSLQFLASRNSMPFQIYYIKFSILPTFRSISSRTL